MADFQRHPLSIAWDEWIESEKGRMGLSATILKDDGQVQYLRNRLQLAFLAGAAAQEQIDTED